MGQSICPCDLVRLQLLSSLWQTGHGTVSCSWHTYYKEGKWSAGGCCAVCATGGTGLSHVSLLDESRFSSSWIENEWSQQSLPYTNECLGTECTQSELAVYQASWLSSCVVVLMTSRSHCRCFWGELETSKFHLHWKSSAQALQARYLPLQSHCTSHNKRSPNALLRMSRSAPSWSSM